MLTFLIRRLVVAVLLLAAVSLVTFGIFFLLPRLAGVSADRLATEYAPDATNASRAHAAAHQLGLDQSFVVQYWHFLRGLLLGADEWTGTVRTHCAAPCLGFSSTTGQPVWPQLSGRLPVTASLALGAAVLWLAFGVGAGVLGSLRPNGWLDRALGAGMLAGVSLPVFVTAPIALLLLNFTWHVFPTVGYRSLLPNPLAWAGGLLLPWCVLAFSYAAMYARLTRAGMAEALREDYVRTARAKGLSERRVVLRHALRAAIMPVVTVFGMDLGMLLGGAVVAEQVFSLPGIGQATVLAVKEEDLPTVMGITLLAATFVIVANIVVDAGYTLLDPRVGRRAR